MDSKQEKKDISERDLGGTPMYLSPEQKVFNKNYEVRGESKR